MQHSGKEGSETDDPKQPLAPGDVVHILRPRGQKKSGGAYGFTDRLPTRGVVEQCYPRFVVVRMLDNVSARPLYRECFSLEQIHK